MVKTLKQKNKPKSNNSNVLSFVKSIVNTKVFSSKINIKSLYIYLAISLLILVILTLIKSNLANTLDSIMVSTFYAAIGIPLVFLLFFTIFYIFLNSFENKRKPFWESFLVFLAIIFPFVIVGNFITIISANVYNSNLIYFLGILLITNIIYFIINFILSFKNYYNTSGFKIISSLILVEVFIGTIAIVQYLSILINSLK